MAFIHLSDAALTNSGYPTHMVTLVTKHFVINFLSYFMSDFLSWLFLTLGVLVSAHVSGQPLNPAESEKNLNYVAKIEITAIGAVAEITQDRPLFRDIQGGVITNQTVTVAGQDFYSYFAAAWHEKDPSDNYALSIKERPSARFGNEVTVEFAQRKVFRAYLPPARASIKLLGAEAAEITYQGVLQSDLQNKLVRDPDMAADEIF